MLESTDRVATFNTEYLKVPENFPVLPKGIKKGERNATAKHVFPLAMAWADHYLKNFETEQTKAAPADILLLADWMVDYTRGLETDFEQAILLKARTEERSARLLLHASRVSGNDESKQALAYFDQALARLNPELPLVWAWREAVARDLYNNARNEKFKKNREDLLKLAEKYVASQDVAGHRVEPHPLVARRVLALRNDIQTERSSGGEGAEK